LRFPSLKAIFTTAETLLPEYRKTIEESFMVPVFDGYGMGDGGADAVECDHNKGLHISMESAVIEFIPISKKNKSNKMQNLIVTDLYNYSFPFIRYDVGDIGTPSIKACTCGRGLPLIEKIEGRVADIIRFPDGKIWPPPILTLVFAKFDIVNYQILQETKEFIRIKIVKGNNFSSIDATNLKKIFLSHMGPEGELEIEYTDSIPITSSGKRRFVISKLN